jgi:hypothetical protein
LAITVIVWPRSSSLSDNHSSVFACTPDRLPDLMAAVLAKRALKLRAEND